MSALIFAGTFSRSADRGVDVLVELLLDWPPLPPVGCSVLPVRNRVFEPGRGSEQEW